MDTLDAVNLILRNIGENPLASLEIQYPTLDIVLPALEEATHEVLTEGWWFNTRYDITLQPSISGEVVIPTEAISFIPSDSSVTFEGTRLINKDTGAPILNTPVRGKLITSLPFEQCPATARYTIAYLAAYQVYVSDSGEDGTSATIAQRHVGYAAQLSAEHTRSQKFNSRRRRTVQRWQSNLRT